MGEYWRWFMHHWRSKTGFRIGGPHYQGIKPKGWVRVSVTSSDVIGVIHILGIKYQSQERITGTSSCVRGGTYLKRNQDQMMW